MISQKKAVVLLSGGLDSLVSLAFAINQNIDVKLALTFDYGQKSFSNEYLAAKKISDFYGIRHKIIKLDWLNEITNSALVSDLDVPILENADLDNMEVTKNSMKSVWVPNRNALFANIAASFCDSFEYDYIILGANLEEAQTFSDNSFSFVERINKLFEYSTNHDIKLFVPLISMVKKDIVQKAMELNAPLELVNSCYLGGVKHCGKCESCIRLKRALQDCGNIKLIEEIFG